MPAAFRPALIADAAMWRPLRLNPTNPPRDVAVFHTIGRLKAGRVAGAGASRPRPAGAAAYSRRIRESDRGNGINPVPLQEQQVGDDEAGARSCCSARSDSCC